MRCVGGVGGLEKKKHFHLVQLPKGFCAHKCFFFPFWSTYGTHRTVWQMAWPVFCLVHDLNHIKIIGASTQRVRHKTVVPIQNYLNADILHRAEIWTVNHTSSTTSSLLSKTTIHDNSNQGNYCMLRPTNPSGFFLLKWSFFLATVACLWARFGFSKAPRDDLDSSTQVRHVINQWIQLLSFLLV